MVSNKKQRMLLCATLISFSNIAHATSINDFFNDLFDSSFELTTSEKKQSWADIQQEIEATTPQLHEVAYLLDQIHDKNRENLTATLASINKTQQQLENVKARLEDHIATSNNFDIQEEQTIDSLIIKIATPGFDSKNTIVLINTEEKSLVLEASRRASNQFSYTSTEVSSTGKQSTINYENGILNVSMALSDDIDYTNHTVEFGDDEIIIRFPFLKIAELISHENSEQLNFLDSNEDKQNNNNQEDEITDRITNEVFSEITTA